MIMFARNDDAPPPLTDEQQKLFDEHIPAVGTMAKRRATQFIPFGDQMQHGLIGLLDAARRFDPERGLQFWAFAKPRVVGAMIDAERDGFGNAIHVPRSSRKHRTPEEWARFQAARFEADEQAYIAAGAGRWIEGDSLAAPADESPIDAEALWRAVSGLGKQAALVVMMYHRMHMTMREIGENLGLSESRVSQVRMEALKQLRTNPRVLAASGRRATA